MEDLSSGRLHSVRIQCLTPAQWQRQGAPHSYPQVPGVAVPPPVPPRGACMAADEATRDSAPEEI